VLTITGTGGSLIWLRERMGLVCPRLPVSGQHPMAPRRRLR